MPELALSLASLLPHNAEPYFAMVVAGFAIGIVGHMAGSRRLVVVGVTLIVLGAFLLPLTVNLTESTPPQLEDAR